MGHMSTYRQVKRFGGIETYVLLLLHKMMLRCIMNYMGRGVKTHNGVVTIHTKAKPVKARNAIMRRPLKVVHVTSNMMDFDYA